MNEKPKTADALATERTDLALDRTAMAANRTLMACVRTGLSLITFGFTIYKFLLNALKTVEIGKEAIHGPRRLGLFLIALGTATILSGTIENFLLYKRLEDLSDRRIRPFNYSFYQAIAVGLLGLFLLITIFFRMEVF